MRFDANKKFRALATLVLAAIVSVGCNAGNGPPRPNGGTVVDATPIHIGAILPLTGDAAQYGMNDKEGIDLAVAAANRSGGINGRKIVVNYEDCQTDPKAAVAAFNKLRGQGVTAIIDDAISTISLALVPQLESNNTVLLSTGASNPTLSGASPFFFRIWNSDAYEGVIASNYLKSKFPKGSTAVLYINSDYGKGLAGVIGGTGLRIVSSESFDKDARDFRNLIAKTVATKPSVVYLVGYAAQTGPLLKQMRQAGVTLPVVGTVAMEDPVFVKLAAGAAEGVVYPFPKPPSGGAVESFKKAFRTAYSKDPGLLHDCGYDAANLLIDAIRAGGTEGPAIRDALSKVRGYAGASGTISFDKNGDVSKPMEMKIIKSGKFVKL